MMKKVTVMIKNLWNLSKSDEFAIKVLIPLIMVTGAVGFVTVMARVMQMPTIH